MSDGALAIYVSLATALTVWATIALYLGRVGARLRALQQELQRMPPGEPPAPPPRTEPQPDAGAVVAPASVDHPVRLLVWLMATECGCADASWLLRGAEPAAEPHASGRRTP